MKRRSGKFWRSREKAIMSKIGLKPVPGSGSGELYKEDGENDYILCQLKSTEQESIKINRLDVEKLIYHADLVNKIPIFVIDFLPDLLLVCSPLEELPNISGYLKTGTGKTSKSDLIADIESLEKQKPLNAKVIKASAVSVEDAIKQGKSSLNIDKVKKSESYAERAERMRRERRNKNN